MGKGFPASYHPAAGPVHGARVLPQEERMPTSEILALEAPADVVAAHLDDSTAQLFGITELCREFGITLRAIRFYEDKGLLTPRRVNGARVYTRRDRARLMLILRAKSLGSSLTEIKHYLDLYATPTDGPLHQLQAAEEQLARTLEDLRHKRADIDATVGELEVLHGQFQRQIEQLA